MLKNIASFQKFERAKSSQSSGVKFQRRTRNAEREERSRAGTGPRPPPRVPFPRRQVQAPLSLGGQVSLSGVRAVGVPEEN